MMSLNHADLEKQAIQSLNQRDTLERIKRLLAYLDSLTSRAFEHFDDEQLTPVPQGITWLVMFIASSQSTLNEAITRNKISRDLLASCGEALPSRESELALCRQRLTEIYDRVSKFSNEEDVIGTLFGIINAKPDERFIEDIEILQHVEPVKKIRLFFRNRDHEQYLLDHAVPKQPTAQHLEAWLKNFYCGRYLTKDESTRAKAVDILYVMSQHDPAGPNEDVKSYLDRTGIAKLIAQNRLSTNKNKKPWGLEKIENDFGYSLKYLNIVKPRPPRGMRSVL